MSEAKEKKLNELYSADALSGLNRELKSRWIVLGAAAVLLLAVFVFSFIRRIKWLSMASLIALGFFAIFWIDLYCMPGVRYRNLLRSALAGRSHTGTMPFVRLEPDPSMVDGVPCRSMIFLGDPDKHGSREQLFYWDQKIPVPDLEPGREYTFRYTGRNIIAIDA